MDSDPAPLLLILNQAFVNPPTTEVIIAGFVILLLICLSAVMSASEVAFFSLTAPEVDIMAGSDDAAEKRVARLLGKPRFLLSSILIANNLLNIGTVITSYYVTKQMLNFQDLILGALTLPASVLEFIWNVVVVTFMLVLFGEATPKVFATQYKIPVARSLSASLLLLTRFLYPINFVLVNFTQLLEKRLKRHNAEIDIEEINKAIEITVEKKESKQDAKLLKGIVHFGNITVKQIMRPRTDVSAVDYELTFDELTAQVREMGYSRFPVFKENLDQVVGVLNVKDLLEHIAKPSDYEWQQLVREAFFVPETKKIDDLLREIQQNRKHLAVVVDEFGGTSGIITLEDIVEEVVGDIKDEFDDTTEADYRKLDDRNYLFEGKTTITDFCNWLELSNDFFDDVRGESETLGGMILEVLGRMPKNGDDVSVRNFRFLVVALANNRIEKIKVTNES